MYRVSSHAVRLSQLCTGVVQKPRACPARTPDFVPRYSRSYNGISITHSTRTLYAMLGLDMRLIGP